MGWLSDWKRRRVLAKYRIEEALWAKALRGLSFIQALSAAETAKLKDYVILFLAEKELVGAHGLRLTDSMRISIAAQACLLVLELGLEWYSGWRGVVVYPGDFRVRRSTVDEDGVHHEWDDELSGEAMPGGPVALSWDAAANDPWMNVVIHEFAHKLDMRNGVADGMPPLHAGLDRRAWAAALNEAYQGFCKAVDRGRDTWLDPYACEHESEFFAVISEAFFEDPKETRRRYPDVYDQLKAFYRQDPAARVKSATMSR